MKLKDKLKNREFVTTIEIESPKASNVENLYNDIKPLLNYIDAINITDNPMAKLKMSPIALGHLIQEKLKIETIFHFTCRDRNLLGIQSELLGANALNVKNILTLTGDKPEIGDHPNATGVFDVNSNGLAKIAKSLNEGKDIIGNSIKGKTEFFIGGVVNPCADDLDKEIEKIHLKIESGVNFFQTQPIFDIKLLEIFLKKIEKIKIPIIYGLMPLKGLKSADYINRNVPGINIPKEYMDRLGVGGRCEGIKIAKELLGEMRNIVDGVHIFSMGDANMVVNILGE